MKTKSDVDDSQQLQWRKDFPLDLSFIAPTRYSLDYNSNVDRKRHIIIKDYSLYTSFRDVILKSNNKLCVKFNVLLFQYIRTYSTMYIYKHYSQFKSFEEYGKLNATLEKWVDYSNDAFIKTSEFQSFITRDNRYIITYNNIKGYNVYDIENDKWLLQKDYAMKFANILKWDGYDDGIASVFINDEIIITSDSIFLYFHYIPTRDLKYLIEIKQYKLKTQELDYSYHGMCCIQLNCDKDETKKINQFSIKLLIVGGSKNTWFLQSFLIVDVLITVPFYRIKPKYSIDFNPNDFKFDKYNINVKVTKETKMDGAKMTENEKENNLLNYGFSWKQFGCICLTPIRNSLEPIVLLIGGDTTHYSKGSNSIILLDIMTSQMKIIENVCKICILYCVCVEG